MLTTPSYDGCQCTVRLICLCPSFLAQLCLSHILYFCVPAGHMPSNRCPEPWLHVSATGGLQKQRPTKSDAQGDLGPSGCNGFLGVPAGARTETAELAQAGICHSAGCHPHCVPAICVQALTTKARPSSAAVCVHRRAPTEANSELKVADRVGDTPSWVGSSFVP